MNTDKVSAPLMNNYGTRALSLVKGQGALVWDDQGNQYLDALCGIAVCGLGHAHPAVTRAVSEQIATLVHCSNLYNIPVQRKLAERLCQLSGMTNAFFCNSGAEANEAAIKLARLYGQQKRVRTPTIIVTEKAFHGRTMATLTATGNRKVQAGFEPLLKGFTRAPFGDIETIEKIAGNNSEVVAVLVEPIQGEGGVRVPDHNYLKALRRSCDRHGWLLMLDEVQTSNGRTGTYFHYQQHDILPDVVTSAKGVANGFPLGVCLASGKAATLMTPGSHGSTFGGNPVACRAALATIDTIMSENLCQRAADLGARLMTGFKERLVNCSSVVDIRGAGLMIGIELNRPCGELVSQAALLGLLINVTADRVIRLLPPLNFTDAQADQLVSTLSELVIRFG